MGFASFKARIGTVMTDVLVSRQDRNGNLTGVDGNPPTGFVEEHDRQVPFWWSRDGVIIKWSIFLGFTVLFGLYLIIGYSHAKRRIRKGLPPLGYHRWLVSRQDLARTDPRYAWPQASFTNYQPGYGMQAMPPPVYDPNRPPMYEGGGPPMGGKIDPIQGRHDEEYAAPLGPPPHASLRPERTGGSTNPFVDPARR